MNRNTAIAKLSALNSGVFCGSNKTHEGQIVALFSHGHARDSVADYGLSRIYNSGREIIETVPVTDAQCLRAMRRLARPS